MRNKVMLNIHQSLSWNSHASSMYSVLQHSGMIQPEIRFSDYLGMTGNAFQFITHQTCSYIACTMFNWAKEYEAFLNRVGVMTDIYFAMPGHLEHQKLCSKAELGIKTALESGVGSVLWGVEAAAYGVVYGYDDVDQVFYVSGIGSSDCQYTFPLLYSNLGNCYDKFPILFCQIPKQYEPRDLQAIYLDSLRYYTLHMRKKVTFGDYSSGLEAYRRWKIALDGAFDHSGLRYLVGVYAEKKLHAAEYIAYMRLDSKYVQELIQASQQIAKLFLTIHYEILEQDFNGWNHLHRPVSDAQAKRVQELLAQAEVQEEYAVSAAERVIIDINGHCA